jgi:hypothetical protein
MSRVRSSLRSQDVKARLHDGGMSKRKSRRGEEILALSSYMCRNHGPLVGAKYTSNHRTMAKILVNFDVKLALLHQLSRRSCSPILDNHRICN